MKHVPIVGKFLMIMVAFGLLTLLLSLYESRQLYKMDAAYSGLLDGESTAALYLSRSNRSMQAVRASIGDLLMSRSEESNARAISDLQDARQSFTKFMDVAIRAMPTHSEIAELRTSGLQIIDTICAATIAAGSQGNRGRGVAADLPSTVSARLRHPVTPFHRRDDGNGGGGIQGERRPDG